MLDATDLVHAFLTREAKEGRSSEERDDGEKVAREVQLTTLVQDYLLEAGK